MPPQQGEVSLLTLFSDIHYYFSPPSVKPPHHRFDKASYVYLHHNPLQQRGRIEIANHAGTPDQDAFSGYLDSVKIEQTYKQPCLITVTVDAFRSQNGNGHQSPQQDMSQWHLAVPDPRNDGRYMYRIHTLDLYFWTPDDATMFIDSLKRVVQPHQLQILSNPQAPTHAEHKTDMLSPVIANLEKAAISHTSRSPSISTTHSFPGPPTAPLPSSGSPATDPSQYAPMAYNPAAPAAPEPIAHREKTPPPPDGADGTGLGAAAIQDQLPPQYGYPLQTSFAPQPTCSQPYMPGPPSRTHTQSFSGPPTPGVQRSNTAGSVPPPPPPQSPPSFAPPPSAPPLGQYDQQGPPQPGLQRHSTLAAQQFASYPGALGYPSSTSPLPSPGYAPQHYQHMASPPPGGYSQFQYGNTSQQPTQQVYRPTEQEAQAHEPAPVQRNSNIGKRAEKVEKGVGRFLKKLDKKF